MAHEGHGNHWEAIFEDVSKIQEWLPIMVERGRSISARAPGPLAVGETIGIAWPDAALCGLSLITGDSDEETRFVFASGYPFAVRGIRQSLIVEQVIPWKSGIEAWIKSRMPNNDGPELTFFDTRFFAAQNSLVTGMQADFILAGLAYFIKVSHQKPAVISDPDRIRMMRAGTAQADDPSPVEVQMEGAAILFPCCKDAPDEYEFHGPVKAVETFQVFGKPMTRLTLTIARLFDDRDKTVDIELYVSEHAWRSNERPLPGANVAGVLWLQGHLAEKPKA